MKYQEVYRMVKQAMVKEALNPALATIVGKGARNMLQGPAPAPHGAENGQAVPRGASRAQLQQMADYNKSVTPYRAAGAAIKDFAGTVGKGLSQTSYGRVAGFLTNFVRQGLKKSGPLPGRGLANGLNRY